MYPERGVSCNAAGDSDSAQIILLKLIKSWFYYMVNDS